jgi:Asp-tRNA(Asn)/Glu-tRNA(Gln) amidotransferase A subunit family amidase
MFIHSAAEEIRHGRLSPVSLLERCLARIDRYEDRVRAWVLVDRAGALEQAKAAEAEIKAGRWRGPLHGIPLGIKDIIDVFDQPTAAGSRLWKDSIARNDATVVRRLRSAGAVIVGKTVTTQYASFDPPPTRNPWKTSRTPGGSSSGSAAAVACGMCLGALATQTGGSITRPASYCGVAGIKPTHGRVSTHGVLPLAPSMDHIGAMASCVRDLAIILQAIAGGGDPTDPGCLNLPVQDLTALREVRYPLFFRVRGLFTRLADATVTAMVERAVAALEARGATIRDVALPGSFEEVLTRHRTVMAVEAAAYHEPRLRRHPEDYGPCITQLLKEGLACPAPEFARTMEHKKLLTGEVATAITPGDSLLMPATTCPAPDAATTGDPAFNSPWSYTGLPTVSFVAGWTDDGLPLGLQLVGEEFGEAELLARAAWCEEVLAVPPREPAVAS